MYLASYMEKNFDCDEIQSNLINLTVSKESTETNSL